MLVDGKVNGTGMCKSIFGFSLVDSNESFWFYIQGETQGIFDCKVQVDKLCWGSSINDGRSSSIFVLMHKSTHRFIAS